MTDEQVMDKLDDAYFAHLLESDTKWKVVKKALEQKKEEAVGQFKKVNPANSLEVAKIQWTIEWCDHFMEKIFRGAKKDGENALLEAQDRGLVPEAVSSNDGENTAT